MLKKTSAKRTLMFINVQFIVRYLFRYSGDWEG